MNQIKTYKKNIYQGMIAVFLAGILFFCTGATNIKEEKEEENLTLYSTAAVLMDADSKKVLYEKNGNDFLSNASTTKIMTCILALEYGLLDDVVEVSPYAASMPKVKLYIKSGEQYKLRDLLYSLMLESHNDSAVAIAEHIGAKALQLPKASNRTAEESKEAVKVFVLLMNEKALEIGCYNTWFITPNGLDASEIIEDKKKGNQTKEHGTTAKDLAKIMSYCILDSPKTNQFLDITRTREYNFCNQAGNRSFYCVNHNAFLGMMNGALSGKTGFTNKAGYCYVGALEREGKTFTIALLGCGWPNHKNYKWKDAKVLFNYGIENFEYVNLEQIKADINKLFPVKIENGKTDKIGQVAKVDVLIQEKEGEKKIKGILLKKDEKIELIYNQKRKLEAPVEAGTKVGSIDYVVKNDIYKSEDIILANSMEEIDLKWCIWQIFQSFLIGTFEK